MSLLPEIYVANRPSNVAASLVSRSLQARIIEPIRYLSEANVLRYRVCPSGEILGLTKPSWIIFNKAIDTLSLQVAKAAQLDGIKIAYDIDDHILQYPSYSEANLNDLQNAIIKEFLQISDVVTVANEKLFYLYSSKCNHIAFLPNGIDLDRYIEKPNDGFSSARKEQLTVGFTNADHLKMVKFKSGWIEAISTIKTRFPHVRFAYFGDFSPSVLGLEGWDWLGSVDLLEYRRSLFAKIFDIALVPLGGSEDPQNFEFNGCKNPFKYLEFGSAGIPAIYSKVPIYENVIKDNHTGFLVPNEPGAWVTTIEKLLNDNDMRRQIASNASADVREKFHIRYAAASLKEILMKT